MAKSLRIATLGRVDFVERVQRMAEDRSFSYELLQRTSATRLRRSLTG